MESTGNISFLHITSPVKVSKERDLYFAQPVTFETFKIAKKFAEPLLKIEQCSIQFDEDKEVVPFHIKSLGSLSKSLKDLGDYIFKFPFIKEILDQAYTASKSYDYIIYSNVDISLMPAFYVSLAGHIQQGFDALIINRRSITDQYRTVSEIPLMWAEVGEKHIGWDCFVFRRDLYPKFLLKDTVLGAVGIGRIMYANLKFFGTNFIELKDTHLTFHLGNSPTSKRQYTEPEWIKANLHNDEQLEMIYREMLDISGIRDTGWIQQGIAEIRNRRIKYLEGLNGVKRFPGYWQMKRVMKAFHSQND